MCQRSQVNILDKMQKIKNTPPMSDNAVQQELLSRKSSASSEQPEFLIQKTTQPPSWSQYAGRISQEHGVITPTNFYKIKNVKIPEAKSQDVVNRLKASWLGNFYSRNLKRHTFVRLCAIWAWRIFYPIYVNYIATLFRNNHSKRWHRLTKLNEFAKINSIPISSILEGGRVDTPTPIVTPVCDQSYLVSPHNYYEFPHIYVVSVDHGLIYGGTNLVLMQNEVICHDLYDFERDYTSEELHGRNLIAHRKNKIRWLLNDDMPEYTPRAATFVDACAPNYAHWLTEVLPRIAAFCAHKQFKDIPLVINNGLHKNIMESLFLMAGPDREIITLPIGRALEVDSLYLTSVAGYVPFERRNNKIPGHSHGLFSPRAFELIRNKIFSCMATTLEQVAWPEKIYLRRNSGVRNIKNSTVLESLLTAKGYMIVEPEKLTFLQQCQLFFHAKVIVSVSGAALANILFSPPGAKIFILINKYPSTSYWYWQNIACASGNTVRYIFGESIGSVDGIHADFVIDIENMIKDIGEEL